MIFMLLELIIEDELFENISSQHCSLSTPKYWEFVNLLWMAPRYLKTE
jgi:hypothetical protein